MDIFVYSDESGVFDKIHNEHFVFGGLIFLSKEQRDENARKYSHVERVIRNARQYESEFELKACKIGNKDKIKLYRSLNQCYKFGAIIHQGQILDRIFNSKKDKQRYLDFSYKIAVKRAFESLISVNIINPSEVQNIYFFTDEHTTATNGRYELKEALEQEFKSGTYTCNFSHHFPPIFPNLKQVDLKYCNSDKMYLIRAADIVANHIYYMVKNEKINDDLPEKLLITEFPEKHI